MRTEHVKMHYNSDSRTHPILRIVETMSHEISLVEQAKAGNRSAYSKLADTYYLDIFRMVYFRIQSRMDTEDLTQDIFFQAFKNLPRLQKNERFKSWLFSIAINRIRDFKRRKRFLGLFSVLNDYSEKDFKDSTHQDSPDAIDNLVKQDFWRQITSLMKKLSRMEREVFMLRFMNHLSIKEVSDTLKKSESTIKTHLYRALRKFKNESSLIEFLRERNNDS